MRIIWGRHTDPEGDSIKRDLCSPVGQGVHAKAFYFLLGKYREESLRNNYDSNSQLDLSNIRDNFDLGTELSSVNKKYPGNRSSVLLIEPPPGYSSATAPAPSSGLVPPSMRRTGASSSSGSSSRERAPSPAGPRAPPYRGMGRNGMDLWRARSNALDDKVTKFSINSPKATIFSGIARGGPRPLPARRGYTYSHPNEDISTIQFPELMKSLNTADQERPKSTMGIPRSPRLGLSRASMLVPSPDPSFLQAQTPRPTASSTLSVPTPTIDAPLPLLPSKRALNVNMAVDRDRRLSMEEDPSSAMSEGMHNVNVTAIEDLAASMTMPPNPSSAASISVAREHAPTPPEVHRDRVIPRTHEVDNKENQSIGDDSWSHVSAEEQKGRAVGLGMGLRDVGRNMGNIMTLRDSGAGIKGKKERKLRRRFLFKRKI